MNFTLQNGAVRFGVGTSVSAYPRSTAFFRGDIQGAPQGAATATAVVASDGSLTFTSLSAATEYVAYASVSGQDRYVSFVTGVPLSGTLAARPPATAALEGMDYFATDDNGGTVYTVINGAWTKVSAGATETSGRELGYAEATANQTFTTTADVTSLTTTVTVGTRPVLAEAWVGGWQNSIAGSGVILTLLEDGSIVSRTDDVAPAANTNYGSLQLRARRAPSAGSHTYKVQCAQLTSGTVTLLAGAPRPMHVHIREC